MKISRIKFILIFLGVAFVFQFVTNSILGPEVRPFPENGDWFPGKGSPIAWKNTTETILYPIKIVLVGPLSKIFNDPDPAPPIRGLGVLIYWSALALLVYFIVDKIVARKKTSFS